MKPGRQAAKEQEALVKICELVGVDFDDIAKREKRYWRLVALRSIAEKLEQDTLTEQQLIAKLEEADGIGKATIEKVKEAIK